MGIIDLSHKNMLLLRYGGNNSASNNSIGGKVGIYSPSTLSNKDRDYQTSTILLDEIQNILFKQGDTLTIE